MDRIGVVGASYRSTTIDKLARATLAPDTTLEQHRELARLAGFTEMVYLSTCNRVEFYFRSATRLHTNSLLFHLRRSLADLTDGKTILPDEDDLYIHFGRTAVRHLFRVTSALDSMMVGEAQIGGQVKEAHERAHEAGLLDGILDQTFHEAFHLAKRVRSDTELARRPVSLVTLVSRRMEQHLATSSEPVLILGAGLMAKQVLRLLRQADPEREITVANRTVAKALEMVAGDKHASAISLQHGVGDPPRCGLIVAATSFDGVVFDASAVERVKSMLPTDETLVLVDLAMPPNISPDASHLDNVELHGIEEMRAEAETNRELRAAEVDRCENLVDHQLQVLRLHLLNRAMSPAARALKASFKEAAAKSLERGFGQELRHLAESDRKAVERLVRDLTKRLVQIPVQGLKGAAWHHSSAVLDNFVKGVEGDLDLDLDGRGGT
jgi:glutamyl-tRNA reductase